MTQQGDQYNLVINIEQDGAGITPDGITGVRVKIGNIEHRYPGDLSFDANSGMWLFPITQEQTLNMTGQVQAQVQVNYGGTPAQIVASPVQSVYIGKSIIVDAWDD